MATADDVPSKFDLILAGMGFIFNRTQEDKALHGITPTFVPRQNVQGNYGDAQQDFWLTAGQNDWSLGEQQRFLRVNEPDSVRRYWRGENVDVSSPGIVRMRRAVKSLSFSENVLAVAPQSRQVAQDRIVVVGDTKLFSVDQAGSITDHGAHGATVSTFRHRLSLAVDGSGDVYIGSHEESTIRKWDGTTFSTFVAASTGSTESIAYHNNALYGLRGVDGSGAAAYGELVRWDSAGAITVLHTWLGADGSQRGMLAGRILSFGGKLLILWPTTPAGAELWMYDGTGVSQLATFPANFVPNDMVVSLGIVYIGGAFVRGLVDATSFSTRPSIFYYANGSIGELWRSEVERGASGSVFADASGGVALTPWDAGLLFADPNSEDIHLFDSRAGGYHTVGRWDNEDGFTFTFAAARTFALLIKTDDDFGYLFPDPASVATTASLTSSLMDFDSSLPKIFKSIRVDFDDAGGTSTVDIAYRVGDTDGAYTTLQSDAVSGTAYEFSSQITGQSISVKVTLNKGNSTNGPVLKRVAVRAMPFEPTYPKSTYALDLSGTANDPRSFVRLNDGTRHTKSGQELAHHLRDLAINAEPFEVIDGLCGTYSGVVDTDGLEIRQVQGRNQEYHAIVRIREV